MKREELKATEIYARYASEVHDDFGDVEIDQEYYRKEQADSVMDAMEQRIKELEDENWELKHDMEWNAKQYMERNKGATNVIKKMEARIKELELENEKLESAWLHTTDVVKEQLEEIETLTERINELEKVEESETDQLDLFESED